MRQCDGDLGSQCRVRLGQCKVCWNRPRIGCGRNCRKDAWGCRWPNRLLAAGDRKAAIAARTDRAKQVYAQIRAREMAAAAVAWDASPISTARLSQ